MRAVVQRVRSAHVDIDGATVGAIERGLLVYVGFGRGDTAVDRAWMLAKLVGLRIFVDDAPTSGTKKMTLNVLDVGGGLLLVSQFTLYGDLRRGRRPSFDSAMPPEDAERAYDATVRDARALVPRIATGRFRADMQVHAINDGPVTFVIESPGSSMSEANPPPGAAGMGRP